MFDYTNFKIDLKNATMSSFLKLKDVPDLYSFALFSDENCETLLSVANTLSYLKTSRDSYNEPDCNVCKFSPEEWDYKILKDDDSLDDLSRLLSIESMVDKTDVEFKSHQSKIYTSCIQVLIELKNEGFFAKNYDRDLFVIFAASEFEFEKSEQEYQLRQLNSIEYIEEYSNWMSSWSQ